MAFDYIAETKEVISILKSENADVFAKKIQEAMDSAFTSTELLMGVKFHLSKISPTSISSSTMDRIQSLIKQIDRILRK